MRPSATEPLLAALERAAPGGVSARMSDRLARSHDASHFLLVPQAVAVPRNRAEVGALLAAAARHDVPLTFRSGGTSLSGQAGTDGVLVDTRRHFRAIEVLDDGRRVRVQPGATVRAVNTRLARYGRRLGPDPASEIACTIGGVVANNSSGMACGTEANAYRTMDSAVLVLADGTVFDTGAPDADGRLRTVRPDLYAGLVALRDRVRGDPASVATLRRLFAIKNTMGYGLNSLLDHTAPAELLARLVVGSEGTLAFVAEATFRTVPFHPHAATALLLFPALADATASLPELVNLGLAAIELLDARSLAVAQRDPAASETLRRLAVHRQAALLIEHRQPTPDALAERVEATETVLSRLPLAGPAAMSLDATAREALWHIRKGLYATVAGARASGTTALLEDVAVPVGALLPLTEALGRLLVRHGYDDSVIFGHAKDGNLHFLLNQRFDSPAELDRFRAFGDDLADLVLGHGGTLKAEHGTGRMMTPYLERQYGPELVDVMRTLKRLLDPAGRLNPGVIIADRPGAHVTGLKTTPTVEAEVDRCVDCGYCEPVCPSQDLTTTPRQRIALRRELATARARGDEELARSLEHDARYDVVDTCAADGLCATACPLRIDTGDLTRRLRSGRRGQGPWSVAARHWDVTTRLAGAALTAARALPPVVPVHVSAAARTVIGAEAMPAWTPDLPGGGPARRRRPAGDPVALFFPACLGTMFGGGIQVAFLTLCDRAGIEVRTPDGIAGLCCGTPWKSKGLARGHDAMREQVLRRLGPADGLPIVVDASSCTEGLAQLLANAHRTVVDVVAFADEVLLPRLPIARRIPSVVLHPTCSSTRLGLDPALHRLAAVAAHEVMRPDDWGCCAFAGDRGLLHPELTAAATRAEAAEVVAVEAAAHVSLNRTCEIGMTRATGRPYRHVLELLEEVTRPA